MTVLFIVQFNLGFTIQYLYLTYIAQIGMAKWVKYRRIK